MRHYLPQSVWEQDATAEEYRPHQCQAVPSRHSIEGSGRSRSQALVLGAHHLRRIAKLTARTGSSLTRLVP